jgi:hypothetical protein
MRQKRLVSGENYVREVGPDSKNHTSQIFKQGRGAHNYGPSLS